MLDYTLEIYVRDRRCRKGERLQGKYDYTKVSGTWMQEEMMDLRRRLYPEPKYRMELHDTYVTRRNMISGEEFQERYDTPYYCSPSSETYWSS
jgi:hypothetical protein